MEFTSEKLDIEGSCDKQQQMVPQLGNYVRRREGQRNAEYNGAPLCKLKKMSCFLIGAELDKCSEADKAFHTSADGIVWAAAEGTGADWLDLFKGGPWARMRAGDAALTTGGELAARGASVLRTLRGVMLSRGGCTHNCKRRLHSGT